MNLNGNMTNKDRKSKNRYALPITVIAIIVLLLIGLSYNLFSELNYYKYIKDYNKSKNLSYLYDLYLTNNVDPTNVPILGDKNAPLTIIAYLEPKSASSIEFLTDTLPKLNQDYVFQGKLKIYLKLYITGKDIKENSSNYHALRQLNCISQLHKEYYSDLFHTTIISDGIDDIEIGTRYNISTEEFIKCLSLVDDDSNRKDIFRIEKSGYSSQSPIFYIGINQPREVWTGLPRYKLVRKIIEKYLHQIGE